MKTAAETIKIAQEIINKHSVERYLDAITKYFAENPPQLGHGLAHAIEVAIASYDLAVENNYKNPEYLFIAGLFHDIYRPSLGETDEDQTPGADISKDILEKMDTPEELINEIYYALKSHDKWRNEDNPNLFALLLSIGDKIAYHGRNGYGYTWTSAKLLKSIGKTLPYNSHEEAMLYFVKYQQRAWEIFIKYKNQIKGVNKAITSYLDAWNYYEKPIRENKEFWPYVLEKAKVCHQFEYEVTLGLTNDEEKAKQIMIDSIELESNI